MDTLIHRAGASLLTLTLSSWAAAAATDPATLDRIIDAGMNHGEVIETVAYLTDRIGGRMTNSPAMREAERWSQERFRAIGLRNVHPEGFDFGRGWWIESAHTRMVTPRPLDLRAIPVAWTPGTNGPLRAPAIVAPIRTERDFADWQGKLSGKVVLVTWPEPPKDLSEVPFQRLSDADIAKLNKFSQPKFDPDERVRIAERYAFRERLQSFLATEGAVAWARMSPRDGHLVHGEGYAHQAGRTPALPGVEIAVEDYLRLARLARTGPVELELDNRIHFEDADHKAYNVFGEIPGRDLKAGYVMAGAHLDSWVAGDGAADNGAGSAVVIEAARILTSLAVTPKRTIRFALWSGEEQGLYGSADYVARYLARRPPSTDPKLAGLGPYFSTDTYPVEQLPGYAELKAYFNIDNGSGKVRGLYAEGNVGAVPLIRQWLAPFESMGAAAVVAEPTGGTDHVFLSRVGLPAFQFIQDPLDYETRVHHSDLDTFDHLRGDDLRQAAVVLAGVLLQAANSDEVLPRRTLPTAPKATDPFRYREPSKP
jgi:carboxypeptidase Q